MSFEEKYSRYKKSPRFDVSEDYINNTVEQVSNKISSGSRRPKLWIWGISTSLAMVAVFVFVFGPFEQTNNNSITQGANSSNRHMAQLTIDSPADDSNILAVSDKKITFANGSELNQESIIEYLLDEGYEEI